MDAANGPTAPVVTEDPLVRAIREYSLYQGVLLMMKRLREHYPLLDDDALYLRLEFQANTSLGFPGSQIEHIEFFEHLGQPRARMTLNLFGLLGSSSPLPVFYPEQAMGSDSAGRNPTRELVGLFNNRLQRMLLPVWSKYRYYARFQAGASDAFSDQLFALIGLRGAEIRSAKDLNWKRLLPYLGLLGQRAHSAALIEAVLRYYFKHPALLIEQCVQRQVAIRPVQQNSLGHGNVQLGESAVLGERVRDGNGKFRIHISDLAWGRFHDFLPVGTAHTPLCALVRFALRAPKAYDIRLQLRHTDIKKLDLARSNPCRLGWTTWLGREAADGLLTLGARAS